MHVETRYVRSGEGHIAFQVVGEGPLDLVYVPAWISNLEVVWEEPRFAAFFSRLASFSRLILFDRRGTGLSDGTGRAWPLDVQIDDVRAVMDAVGSEQAALIAMNEGGALAALFAASYPQAVRALVLYAPMARLVSGEGYEWAVDAGERAAQNGSYVEMWGQQLAAEEFAPSVAGDVGLRRWIGRLQRLAMGPSTATATLQMLGEIDVRDVLPSIQCPTLVMRRAGDALIDARHSRYFADHVPGARYVELPGEDTLLVLGDAEAVLDQTERFLTGTRRAAVSDRVLATVLFTDIVGSTERAAELGDSAWRSLLQQHDTRVRGEIERQRGRVVKSLGDGILAVFDGPSRAVSSAIAIRDSVHDLGLQVRAGLHTGECELLPDKDIGGLAVHIAARVSALAAPEEVLATSTVRDLVVGSGAIFTDRGVHDLKGIPDHWTLYAVT